LVSLQGGYYPKGLNQGGYAETDAQGRFQFDSLPASATFNLQKDGYTEIEGAKFPLDGTDEVVVTMKPPGVIRCRVVDAATGKPVPRFNVRLEVSPDRKEDEPLSDVSGRSNLGEDFSSEDFSSSKGTFEIKELKAGSPLQLTVQADGYRSQVIRRAMAQPAPKAETIEIRLSKLGAILPGNSGTRRQIPD
jgi:hypothetical protein